MVFFLKFSDITVLHLFLFWHNLVHSNVQKDFTKETTTFIFLENY